MKGKTVSGKIDKNSVNRHFKEEKSQMFNKYVRSPSTFIVIINYKPNP